MSYQVNSILVKHDAKGNLIRNAGDTVDVVGEARDAR